MPIPTDPLDCIVNNILSWVLPQVYYLDEQCRKFCEAARQVLIRLFRRLAARLLLDRPYGPYDFGVAFTGSFLLEMELEIEEMEEYSEYTANKLALAENKLETEKLEIGKKQTLLLLIANVKRMQRYFDTEMIDKRLKMYYRYVDRYWARVRYRRWLVAQSEELAEVEARSDTEVEEPEPIPRFWLGPCGTRFYPEAGICVGPAAQSNAPWTSFCAFHFPAEVARQRRDLRLD